MNIEQKIFYYYHTKWNIPFRELYHTVMTISEIAKPIYQHIETLKYINYFFAEIDFDKIGSNTDKAETLKYCNAIHYGLEHLLKADISKAIHFYQRNILTLSKEQIQETQIILIGLIGSLKIQTRTNLAGISFTQRYNALYNSIETKDRLFNLDYQILIAHFNESIFNDLLSRYEVINETFKEITPLLKALPIQQTETKTEKLKTQLGKYGFFELTKVKQLSEPNRQSLVEFISKNDLPYAIAMLHYLDFLKHLKVEHFITDYEVFRNVAVWFEVGERTVKGNFLVLNEVSKENRQRHTAYLHKERVIKDYETLK